jgi:regulator of protease activity HflC (stomatin/prohibitin superfamily)
MKSFVVALTLLAVGCTTVRPGEVAVRSSFGKLSDEARGPGLVVHSPVGVTFLKVSVQTRNVEVEIDLPSQEGVNVRSSVSILYRVIPAQAPDLLEAVGPDFETSLVMPVFRSASADVSAGFLAKDMHSGQRSAIETKIAERMNAVLGPQGLVVDSVLLKSIKLPAGLYGAIEQKLEAEQEAERMSFVLLRERQEAERRRIEAEGIRDAQRILEEGLSPQILAWRSIEAFQELSQSDNAKIIVTDGNVPFLVNSPTE